MNKANLDKGGDHFEGITKYFKGRTFPERNPDLYHGERYRLDNVGLSYRVINHWENNGLIKTSREGEKGWRKYNMLEVICVRILVELRKFGFPLEKLLLVRNGLEKGTFISECPFSDLEYYTHLCIHNRQPCYLLVFENAVSELVTDTEHLILNNMLPLLMIEESRLVIPLNNIVQAFFENSIKPKIKTATHLSKDERELLLKLRQGGDQSIAVSVEGNDIKELRSKTKEKSNSNISQIMKSDPNQDIIIKVRDGKSVDVQREIIKKKKK